MNLQDLAKEPQLTKITLDEADIVEKYGDSLDFYVYDRQPLDIFARLANADTQNIGEMADALSSLILNAEGKQIMVDGKILPIDVMITAMTKIGNVLGKQQTQK